MSDKKSNISTYMKSNIKNDNKNYKNRNPSKINPVKNFDVIANCLGLESSRIRRKERKDKLNSNSISNIIKKSYTPIHDPEKKNNENISNNINITRINSNKFINNSNTFSKISLGHNTMSKSTKHSKEDRNESPCFIIFNKSNINNLKKNINKIDSKNNTIDNEILNNEKKELEDNYNQPRKYIYNSNEAEKKKNLNNINSHRHVLKNQQHSFPENNEINFDVEKNDIDVVLKKRYLLGSPDEKENINIPNEENELVAGKNLSKYLISLADSKTAIEKGILFIIDEST